MDDNNWEWSMREYINACEFNWQDNMTYDTEEMQKVFSFNKNGNIVFIDYWNKKHEEVETPILDIKSTEEEEVFMQSSVIDFMNLSGKEEDNECEEDVTLNVKDYFEELLLKTKDIHSKHSSTSIDNRMFSEEMISKCVYNPEALDKVKFTSKGLSVDYQTNVNHDTIVDKHNNYKIVDSNGLGDFTVEHDYNLSINKEYIIPETDEENSKLMDDLLKYQEEVFKQMYSKEFNCFKIKKDMPEME